MTKAILIDSILKVRLFKLKQEIEKRIKKAVEEGKGFCVLSKSIKGLPDGDFAVIQKYYQSLNYVADEEFKKVKNRFDFSEKRLFISWVGLRSKWENSHYLGSD